MVWACFGKLCPNCAMLKSCKECVDGYWTDITLSLGLSKRFTCSGRWMYRGILAVEPKRILSYVIYIYIHLSVVGRFQGREHTSLKQKLDASYESQWKPMIASCWERHLISRSNGNRSEQETRWRWVFESLSLNQCGIAMPCKIVTRFDSLEVGQAFFFHEIFCRGNAFQIAHPGPWDSVWSWIVVVAYGWARCCVWRVLLILSQMLQSDVECMDAGLKKLVKHGKALIAKASSFNAKQAWVRNHMADLLPSLTESILYIILQYTAIFGCLWMMTIWTYYQGSPFFSDASSVFLRNSCSRDVLVTGFCLIRFLWWNLDGTISWVLWALFIVHFFVLDVRSSSRSWGTWEVLTEDSDSEGRNLKFLVGEAVTAECLVSRGFD